MPGMLAPEIEQVRNHVERAVQANLGGEDAVREMITVVQCHSAQDVHPDHAAFIVAPPVK